MSAAHRIVPCLWFDTQAEDAANFYVSVFKNSKITSVARYPKAGQETHRQRPGSVMTVAFELDGQKFVALNGGPQFTFSPATSFVVNCETQAEVDEFWAKLSDGGTTQGCGWLTDKFGLTWQIIPTILPELLTHQDPAKASRVMKAMMQMVKIDIEALRRAARDE